MRTDKSVAAQVFRMDLFPTHLCVSFQKFPRHLFPLIGELPASALSRHQYRYRTHFYDSVVDAASPQIGFIFHILKRDIRRNDRRLSRSISRINYGVHQFCAVARISLRAKIVQCKELKLANYIVQDILKSEFSEEYRNNRKAAMYRASKLGDKNPMKGCTGSNHPNWKGGIVDDGNGYQMVIKPKWYTGRKGSDYVFYHSAVMCEAIGITEVPKGFVIHHIDRNPKNNSIDNLALVTVSGHGRLHSIENNLCKVQRLSTKE